MESNENQDLLSPRDLKELSLEDGPTYVVQPGDSLLKIAYLHNISSKSIVTLNNLHSDYINEGQILRLPSQAKAIKIAEVPAADSKITKNTNQKHYLFDDDDLSPSSKSNVKQELRNFIHGFDSYIIPEPSPREPLKESSVSETPKTQGPNQTGLSGFGIVNRLYGKFFCDMTELN